MHTTKSVTGVILAGGKARRMGGVNKALLEVDGRRIIDRIVNALTAVLADIILITDKFDEYGYLGLPMYPDILPGNGSLGGLFTGLSEAAGQYCFLTGCDMPFIMPETVRIVVEASKDQDVVIPRIYGHLEPLHAVYSKRCLPYIEELMRCNDFKILKLLDKVRVFELCEEKFKLCDPEFRFIVNVNSHDDLKRVQAGCRGWGD